MEIKHRHSWKVSTAAARQLQLDLKEEIDTQSQLTLSDIRIVAAADVSFNRFESWLYAAVTLLSFPQLKPLELYGDRFKADFPYVPGFLSFRECPPILALFEKINVMPEVVLCDGQGIAHPRGMGFASHLGLFLDLPTIGCAKSVLVGEYTNPPPVKGNRSELVYNGRLVGFALRTRTDVKPVFVSCGHKINLEDAVKVVLACSPKFRIPEPIRLAHRAVNSLRLFDKCES